MEGTLVETDLGKAHEFDISGYVGDDWCPMHFPTVISATVIDPTSVRLEISDLAPAYGGPTIDGHSSGFATSGRLYITWGDYTIGETYNGAYSSIDATGSYPVIIVSDFRNAIGTPQLASTFANMATEIGTLVSGMLYLPLNVSNNTLEQDALLPPNNCVGLHNIDSGIGPTYSYTYGFKQVVLSKEGSYTFDSKYPSTSPSDGIIPFNTITPLTGNLLINAIDINDTYNFSNVYMPDQTTPIYYHTPHTLYIGEMTDAQWQALYAVGGTYTYAKVILPNVLMTANFFAKEGIFLEPSMPRTCLDLTSSVYPLVVDYHHLLPTPDTEDKSNFIGTRCSNYYDPTSTVQSTGEKVTFQIRSIRRFHKTLEETTVFEKLRYLYEIRRGIVTGYSTITDKQKGIVTASNFYMNYSVTYPKPADVWCNGLGPYNGTNLGPFTSSDVNIQAGDMFRLLDDNGNVIEEIEIDSIQDDSTLILTTPGLQTNPIGQRFEIYLRQSPVPHEQSNEQLLSLMTNKVVCTTNANFDTQLGGYVKDTIDYADVNKLYDDLNTETFTSKGVQKDDIVIIDPVGTLEPLGHPYPAQRGMHPIGDRSTSSRLTEYLAGRPSELDDNRGFYRVTKVVNTPETYLEVSPINTFAGLPDEPVVFGTAGDTEYAVYPTINDSLLAPSHKEGQMDLRPTATRVDGSWYNTEGYSIRPFSYKVIRPSKLFTNESIDLILSTRERMLTWIEMLSPVSDRFKLGSYFIFQKDCQIENLNTLTNPEIGLGVPSNDYLWEITGLNQYVPYANNSSSMSILDRRFWIEDTRLDDLTYDSATIIGMKLAGSGDTTYTDFENDSNIKPVLLGRINNVLEKKDKFYDMRYMWVNYRTNKIFGTLPKIKQFDLELPKKLEEQKATALLVATATKVSDEE
jgi:hypothetical protein